MNLAFALPRLRPRAPRESRADTGRERDKTVFTPRPASDRDFVQILTALRCFLPHAGLTLSTRESAALRDRLLPLGVTRISAGVSTAVGGYAHPTGRADVQFVIDDARGVDDMADALRRLGYQPVFADWALPADGNLPLAGAIRRALGLTGEPAGGVQGGGEAPPARPKDAAFPA